MKQTAVEWLVEQLFWSEQMERIERVVQQAKEMEKEQIIDAYQSDRFPCSEQDAEQYYNETFEK
jgi:Leu/Phe-tRNA-protein transferase